jgi:tetratricopeptide (TPR) repeat protein
LEYAERAFELAPDLPEANLALGLYYYRIERDYPRALGHLARASQLRPGWARAAQVEGWIARRAGQFDLAAQKHREAVDLDPLNFDTRDDLAQTLGYMREFEEADEWSRSALELGGVDRDTHIHRAALLVHWRGDFSGYQHIPANQARPFSRGVVQALYGGDFTAFREHALPATEQWFQDSQLALTPMALIHAIYYAWTGDEAARNRTSETAVELLEPRLIANPNDPRPRVSLALAYAYLGRAADAVREADRAVELAQNDTYRIQASELRRMWVHTVLGDADAAAIAFERNVTLQGLGWSVRGLLVSPFLDSVRDDPAFAAVVERLREEGH